MSEEWLDPVEVREAWMELRMKPTAVFLVDTGNAFKVRHRLAGVDLLREHELVGTYDYRALLVDFVTDVDEAARSLARRLYRFQRA